MLVLLLGTTAPPTSTPAASIPAASAATTALVVAAALATVPVVLSYALLVSLLLLLLLPPLPSVPPCYLFPVLTVPPPMPKAQCPMSHCPSVQCFCRPVLLPLLVHRNSTQYMYISNSTNTGTDIHNIAVRGGELVQQRPAEQRDQAGWSKQRNRKLKVQWGDSGNCDDTSRRIVSSSSSSSHGVVAADSAAAIVAEAAVAEALVLTVGTTTVHVPTLSACRHNPAAPLPLYHLPPSVSQCPHL